jgi:hypothetical protein
VKIQNWRIDWNLFIWDEILSHDDLNIKMMRNAIDDHNSNFNCFSWIYQNEYETWRCNNSNDEQHSWNQQFCHKQIYIDIYFWILKQNQDDESNWDLIIWKVKDLNESNVGKVWNMNELRKKGETKDARKR